jgi:hypothetical protein
MCLSFDFSIQQFTPIHELTHGCTQKVLIICDNLIPSSNNHKHWISMHRVHTMNPISLLKIKCSSILLALPLGRGHSSVYKSSPWCSVWQSPMASKKHCIHTIMLKTVFFLPLDIVRPQDLCEPPATGFWGSIFSVAGNILFNSMVLKLTTMPHLAVILQNYNRKRKADNIDHMPILHTNRKLMDTS